MLKVSVIIPVFNAAPYLRRCLDSVLNQSLREIEVVCVDDGSNDASAAILSEYGVQDNRVLIIAQPNLGQGAARNHGLDVSVGEYVYFMDADDELADSDALARLVEVMEHDSLEVLLFDAEIQIDHGVDVEGHKLRSDSYIRCRDYSAVRMGRGLFADMVRDGTFLVSPCLVLLRRSLIEEHHLRFPSARIFYEDNIFMTRVLLAAERVSHRPWRLYLRKVHADSTVTSKPMLRHLRGYLACYHDACSLLERPEWDRRTRAALVDRRIIYKLHIRRMVEAHPELVAEMKREFAGESAQLEMVLIYPIGEKIVNAFRCLRDRGLVFTVKRVLFGRQS